MKAAQGKTTSKKKVAAKTKAEANPKLATRRGSSAIPLAKNMRSVGHLDLPGGGQVYVEGDYAFVGHMKPPHGTSVIDISNPKKPKVIATLPLETGRSHTHKVRVAGDIMITNVEQNMTALGRKADELPKLRASLKKELGRDPSDAELAAKLANAPANTDGVEHRKPNRLQNEPRADRRRRL